MSDEITTEARLSGSTEEAQFDGVYISTRNNADRAANSLCELLSLPALRKIYLIPSNQADIIGEKSLQHSVLNEYIGFLEKYYPEFDRNDWDLPHKRNFAIWHGKKIGHRTILLLDDDIRFKTHLQTLDKMIHANHGVAIVGGYSIGEFDTSLTGAIAMKHGITRPAFFSGNCLGINLSKFSPYFPYIYNEDWLSILPAILRRDASLVGPVEQLSRRVSCLNDMAKFQEFGEIIADELYSHIEGCGGVSEFTCRLDSFLSTSHWKSVLKDRLQWLSLLKSRAVINKQVADVAILNAAIDKCNSIKTIDIVNFIDNWKVEHACWEAGFNNQMQLINKRI